MLPGWLNSRLDEDFTGEYVLTAVTMRGYRWHCAGLLSLRILVHILPPFIGLHLLELPCRLLHSSCGTLLLSLKACVPQQLCAYCPHSCANKLDQVRLIKKLSPFRLPGKLCRAAEALATFHARQDQFSDKRSRRIFRKLQSPSFFTSPTPNFPPAYPSTPLDETQIHQPLFINSDCHKPTPPSPSRSPVSYRYPNPEPYPRYPILWLYVSMSY